MIDTIVKVFQNFRNRLFSLFPYRADATMDFIDALAGEPNFKSTVKLSLSDLFRRQYSSLTDVLDSLFRSNLKNPPREEDTQKHTPKIMELLAEACPPSQKKFSLFAVDCTANPRIFADKLSDRTMVHAPNHVPGQKPITVGHEYSTLVHLPDNPLDRRQHWVIPLSVQRVASHETGAQTGFAQFKKVVSETAFKGKLCVMVADAAYSTKESLEALSQCPDAVLGARMRGNRKVFKMPLSQVRRGRPLVYGDEILLKDPTQPDLQEFTTTITRSGQQHQVFLDRWNDVMMQGSPKRPFDMLRVILKDKNGKPVYRRPLWIAIIGERRRELSSLEMFESYCQRYDIEHYFRFGKQKLGFASLQTCDTRHEEIAHWVGLLAYNMLYNSRQFAQVVAYPWEKKKVKVLTEQQGPTRVQRDYKRIIRGFGTPAKIPKPRGKSSGRKTGTKGKQRPTCSLIRKSKIKNDETSEVPLRKSKKIDRNRHRENKNQLQRLKRVWPKKRPPPARC